ncbi:MAG: hypothetical protein NTY38_05085 [Acidobacteria bacterium]|nr:hypothetical protein [Acidobacteriota bacterium]
MRTSAARNESASSPISRAASIVSHSVLKFPRCTVQRALKGKSPRKLRTARIPPASF